jgi:hypothetical protein
MPDLFLHLKVVSQVVISWLLASMDFRLPPHRL